MKLCRARFAVFLMSVLVALSVRAFAGAGPAHLLKDINQTLSYQMGSFPGQYHPLGNLTLFRAWTQTTGWEIWRTDGTTAGTLLVKDIWPGPDNGSASGYGEIHFDPADLGNEVFFMGNDGVHGWELWKSDGTEAGTRMVKEIRPGPGGAFDIEFLELIWIHAESGGLVYFVANDGVHGFELWRTDGTEAGTFQLKDIFPGLEGPFGFTVSSITSFFEARDVDGRLFFPAMDGVHGAELWMTDGTAAGTVLVKDIALGPDGSYPSALFGYQGTLLFSAMSNPGDAELWRSDGTPAGTYLVKDISPGPAPSLLGQFTELNGAVFLRAFRVVLQPNGSFGSITPLLVKTDGTAGGTVTLREFPRRVELWGGFAGKMLLAADDGFHGTELWSSDGTPAGTVLLKDIMPGPGSGLMSFPSNIGGKLFFRADDGVHGTELWSSDGTEAGTQLAVEMTPGSDATSGGFFGAGTVCYLIVQIDGNPGLQLWATDGTPEGTRHLIDLRLNSIGVGPGGILLLGADDGSHGAELWKSDGTAAGTVMVKDINPLVLTNDSGTRFVGEVTAPGGGRRVLFNAYDGVQYHLWVSDGTAGGTHPLVTGLSVAVRYGAESAAVLLDGALFFTASDYAGSSALWRSDGTAEGTFPVAQVGPEFTGTIYPPLVECAGALFFAADDGVHGIELWKSDGTQTGTVLVADILPGPDASYPDRLFALGDTLYFAADDGVHGIELWKSDGTLSGTVLVKDISAGEGSYPEGFSEIGGKLFFFADDSVHSMEPWVSDGTEAGTHLLRDILAGNQSSQTLPSLSMKAGGSIYFTANDAVHGKELWKTDGTEEGTVLVMDIQPGASSSNIESLSRIGETLLFTKGPPVFNDELWRSDGTEEGTVKVKGDLGAVAYGLHAVTGGLVFMAYDDDHGYEPWRSDGTAQGTSRAQDIFPGPFGSRPQRFVELGDRVFFVANDGATGEEPWAARTAILLGQPGRALEDLSGEVRGLHLLRGLETGLTRMLDAAAGALSAGRTTQAILLLEAFSRHLDALTPGRISEASGDDLREFAGEIVELLETARPAAVPAAAPSPGVEGPPRILTVR
jgi:ELWxxDGT repeat protein